MKVCNKCKEEKSYDEFYDDPYQGDGKKTFCIVCDNKQSRLYYEKVKGKMTEKQKLARREAYKRWAARQKSKDA